MARPSVVLRGLSVLVLLALLPALLLASGGDTATAGIPPTPTAQQPRPEVFVLRVYFSNPAERDRLAAELGADEVATTGGYITVTADRDLYNSLLARGQRFDVDEDATRALNTPIAWGNAPDTFYGGYHTVEEVYAFLDDRVADYPNLAEKIDIGDSWCKTHPGACTLPNANNGYDLYALHITNRSIPGPKPVFWYNAGLHSREIAPPELAMRYIDSLLDGYASNADARWLVDWHDIWVMVLHNPDGHHIVEAGTPMPYLHRKNGDRDDGCSTWPPSSSNHFGVDLNRNFPYKWNYCDGCSSGVPCNQTYRGPAENSEEETQAIVAKIRQLIPDQRGPGDDDPSPLTTTGVYLDMHSVVGQNLYPYGWTTTRQAPNHTDLENLAKHMSATNAYPPGNNYQACQAGPCLYATDGASDDWAYGELGVPAFTTELGGQTFTPNYACIDNPGCGSPLGIWPDNRGMLVYLAKVARTPYLTTRGPDSISPVTNPMTVTQGSPVQLTATINYTWASNNYLQNVGGAEYYVGTPPWAGGTGVPMQAVDGAFDEQNEPVQATIDTSSIPTGTYVVFVRGRGVNDYGGLGSWGPVSATWLTVTGGGGATPTGTSQPTSTSTPPPPTATSGAFCITTASGTATCTPPGNYDFSFNWFNICGGVTASVTYRLEVASSPGGPWDVFATQSMSVTINTGNNNTPGRFTNQNVPGQYTHYRIGATLNMHSGEPPRTVTTTPATLCQGPISTPTACTLTFTDVPTDHTFYANIRCLACRGIISGYADGTFRPGNDITRGQISKVVSNAAGFQEPVIGQLYTDVTEDNPFWVWIMRLTNRGVMSGYPCGGTGEPCDPQNRPYFRWGANATRGQLSKIVSNAANIQDPVSGQFYEDVPPTHTFYLEIMRLTGRGVMSGYACGGPGEPCIPPENRPYFRPGANVTRGQASKIVANTFFPDCETP